MFDVIQHVVYINLDERIDRRKHIEGQLSRAFPLERIQRFPAIKAVNGAVGCSRSHIAVLELAKASGWTNVLIIEDDFTWNNYEKGAPVLEALLTKPFDVIVLCGAYVACDPTDYRLKSCQTTTAYVVSQEYYDTLIANYKEGLALFESTGDYPKYALDQYWKRLQTVGQWFIVRPNLGFQLPGYSNVEGKPVNYLRFFK
jgi:glycosyl transferase family 25